MRMRSILMLVLFLASPAWAEPSAPFQGGLDSIDQGEAHPVRNDVFRPGERIVTQRHFKIRKGSFPEFLAASRDGVWPYFEKIGARVVGMWQVIHPTVDGKAVSHEDAAFDEVILMTEYASVDHWRATRETIRHGGDGPDWDACRKALEKRGGLTIETRLRFLQGLKWERSPWFLPGLDERYRRVEP